MTDEECSHRLVDYYEDELTYPCRASVVAEAFTTAGRWEPVCQRHAYLYAGSPDRLRQQQ